MLTICHIIDNKLCAKTLFRKLMSGWYATPGYHFPIDSADSSPSFPHGLDGARSKGGANSKISAGSTSSERGPSGRGPLAWHAAAWDFRGRDSRGEHVGARPRQEGQPTTPARVCRTDRRQGGEAGRVGGGYRSNPGRCTFGFVGSRCSHGLARQNRD